MSDRADISEAVRKVTGRPQKLGLAVVRTLAFLSREVGAMEGC